MTRLLILICLLTGARLTTQAQIAKIAKGDLEWSAGVGILSSFAADRAKTVVPPLSMRLDYRLSRQFTLGAYAAFSATESDLINRPNGTAEHLRNDFTIFGLRAAAHSDRFDNMDIYGGFLLGYSMPKVKKTIVTIDPEQGNPRSNDPDAPSFSAPPQNKLIYSGFVGFTRYFGKKWGVFGEVGLGISLLNAGLSYKF